MGCSKFSGNRPTTVSDTFKGTKIGVYVSDVYDQTGSRSKAKEDTEEQSYYSKRSNFLNEFGLIHLVFESRWGKGCELQTLAQSSPQGIIQDAPTLKNAFCVF